MAYDDDFQRDEKSVTALRPTRSSTMDPPVVGGISNHSHRDVNRLEREDDFLRVGRGETALRPLPAGDDSPYSDSDGGAGFGHRQLSRVDTEDDDWRNPGQGATSHGPGYLGLAPMDVSRHAFNDVERVDIDDDWRGGARADPRLISRAIAVATGGDVSHHDFRGNLRPIALSISKFFHHAGDCHRVNTFMSHTRVPAVSLGSMKKICITKYLMPFCKLRRCMASLSHTSAFSFRVGARGA